MIEMHLLEHIERWRAQGEPVALATVVGYRGSAPRPPGARLAVNARGDIVGSVSGGCVEAEVVETALLVLETAQPQLLHFGISDERAWSAGLMCGGEIDVFVEKLDARFDQIAQLVRAQTPFTLTTLLSGEQIGQQIITLPRADAAPPQTTPADTLTFSETIEPARVLYIVGASHISIALVSIAKTLGYRVIVIDPRAAFATPERFAHADALWVDYPQRVLTPAMLSASTAVAVLTHDPKVDDPALRVALNSEAGYIGALGSRRTHAQRIERLKQAGISDEQIARIHAPIGLDIGARTPAEIALAVAAQMVALQRGGSSAL
jgi:xanthine dehydrogenase accessory factor